MYAFNHLSLADVLSREFSPYIGFEADNNVPAGDIKGSNFILVQDNVYGLSRRNGLMFQGSFYSGGMHGIGAISPADSYSIDSKIDDGIAHTGKLVTLHAFLNNKASADACIDANSWETPANYNLTLAATTCRLFHFLD